MNKHSLIALSCSLLVGACSNSLDCSSDDAKKLISDLTKENELLIKGWQLTALGKAGEVESKMRSQAKNEIDNLQSSLKNNEKNISSLIDECKSSLKQSDGLKNLEGELNLTVTKIGELERINPVQPPRFFWKAGSTQQEHDQWAASEKKYQDDVQRKLTTLRALNNEKINTIKSIEISNMFVVEVCQNPIKRQQSNDIQNLSVLSLSDVEQIISRLIKYNPGKIPEKTIKDAQSFIETKFAAEVNQLIAAQGKINNFNKNLDSEIATARDNEVSKFKAELDSAKYILENIITTNKNDSTGALSCKAEIKAAINESTNISGKVTYTLEKTADKKLYATIKTVN